MRHSQLFLLFGFAFSVTLLVGCGGSGSGSAKPAADMGEIQQYLNDNPDQNVDVEDEDMEVDLAE